MNKVPFHGLKQNSLFVVYDNDNRPAVFRKSIDPVWATCVASDSVLYSSSQYYKFEEDATVIKL